MSGILWAGCGSALSPQRLAHTGAVTPVSKKAGLPIALFGSFWLSLLP
ncbi:MAG: hypothetical protein Q8K34_13395 [Hydrogenophaga sp.]|nr:hypothetical protein [Hydrogenophaga sp.]MDP3921912.1 hypothetical protein [Hydrogenophaga sp.]MDZ4127328.1 hypothetical protein [Hydrogenophaga sp.]